MAEVTIGVSPDEIVELLDDKSLDIVRELAHQFSSPSDRELILDTIEAVIDLIESHYSVDAIRDRLR